MAYKINNLTHIYVYTGPCLPLHLKVSCHLGQLKGVVCKALVHLTA